MRKRLLSLVLAVALTMSLCVIGASATTFSDDKDVVNKEAVDTMVALKVIKGRDNGQFDPKGIVTRAEMCKMICVALNGGKDPVLGTSLNPSYTDIKGHWGEAYIEYCTNKGIVAGQGNGTFAPDAPVSYTAGAKMLLVALGYDAKAESFTGASWAINVNVRANQKGLYEKITGVDPNAGMARDNAAQMIYNTLSADVVALNANGSYDTKEVTNSVGSTVKTGTETWYKLTDVAGGIDLTAVNNAEYKTYADADAAAKGVNAGATLGIDYTLAAVTRDVFGAVTVSETVTQSFGNKYLSLSTFKGVVGSVGYVTNKGYTVTIGSTTFTEIANDPTQFVGEKVSLLYKATDDVYGLFTNKDTTINLNTTIAAMDRTTFPDNDNAFDIGSTTYKSEVANANNIPVYDATGDYLGVFGGTVLATASIGSDVKLVDNNGNGKIDLAVFKKAEVYKVNYVSSTEVTLIAADNADATLMGNVGSLKLADIISYTGIAKDDYVVRYAGTDNIKGDVELKKAETKTLKVKGFKPAGTYNQVMLDGTWFKLMALNNETADFSYDNSITYVEVNGAVYASKVADAAFSGKYLVIKGMEVSYSQVAAKVLFSDGTTKIIDLDKATADGTNFFSVKYDAAQLPGNPYYADRTAGGGFDGTDFKISTDKLYAYTLNSDGKYRLIDTATVANYDSTLGVKGYGTTALNNKSFGSVNIADEATVIVKDTADADNYYVTTGKAVKDWGSSATGAPQYVYTNSNGYSYAKMAFITIATSYSSSDSVYAYVTDIYTTTVNDKAGKQMKLFDGTKTLDRFAADADITTAIAKGDIIEFTTVNDTTVKVPATYTLSTSAVAITGYDAGAKKVTFNTMGLNNVTGSTAVAGDAAYELVDTTKYLYIDSKAVEGKTSGAVSVANKDANGVLIGDMNAMYVMRGSSNSGDSALKDLGLIVIDTANKFDGITSYTMNAATATVNGCTVTITPNTTKAVVGQTVTYTVTVVGNATAPATNITLTFPGLGAPGALTLVGVAGNTTLPGGLVIQTTLAAATNSTYTITGTVTAANITPTAN